MESPSKFRVEIPPGYNTAEGWLVTHDSQPRCIPDWPESTRMCLVACIVPGLGQPEEADHSEAYVLTEKAQANQLVNFCGPGFYGGVLFFRIPRKTVLAPGICPGLEPDSWEGEGCSTGS